MDWGEGRYEPTGEMLESASQAVIEMAAIKPGERVLDIGCGTGNASLIAARVGAKVTGIDLAERLLGVALERVRAEGLDANFLKGDAQALDFDAGSFDATVAVFSSVFAPDAEAVAREMLRVTKKGGRLLFASWIPRGPIHACSETVKGCLPDFRASLAPWGEESFLRERFEVDNVQVRISPQTLQMRGASPNEWFDYMTSEHPIWRVLRKKIETSGGDWPRCYGECIGILEQANEDPERFRISVPYLITLGQVPG